MVVQFNAKFRNFTFDKSIINSNWDKMNRGPIAKAGNTVKLIARRSIRRRKNPNLHSSPGQPPFAHDQGREPRFKLIFSKPDLRGTRAVVGMAGLYGHASPAPHLQEYGGRAYREFTFFQQVRRRKTSGKFRTSGRIRREFKGIVNIPARPFMRPALQKAVASGALPQFWAGALDRATVRA